MTQDNSLRVLIITGDKERAALLARGVTHPTLDVQTASNEEAIVAALTEQQLDLAIVGRQVGRRGPLVLCDAVRVRQSEVPVVVLVGKETDQNQLAEHEARNLDDVHYHDVREVPSELAELRGIRVLALDILGVAEDSQALTQLEESFTLPPPEEVPAADVENGSVEPQQEVQSAESAQGSSGEEGPPPLLEAVTEEDLLFAKRMLNQTRNIDFRTPPPRAPQVDPADQKAAKLRERVRELERHLARLAHVYAGRARDFDTALEQLDESKTRLESRDKDAEKLREHFSDEREHFKSQRGELEREVANLTQKSEHLQGQLADTKAETERLRNELGVKETSQGETLDALRSTVTTLEEKLTEMAQSHAQQLEHLQETLGRVEEERDALQEGAGVAQVESEKQKSEAIELQEILLAQKQTRLEEEHKLSQQLAEATAQLDAAKAENNRLEEQLESQRHHGEVLQQRVHEQDVGVQSQQEKQQGLAVEIERLKADLAAAQDETQRGQAQMAQLQGDLDTTRSELAQLQRRHEEDAKQAQARLDEETRQWQSKTEEVKEAAATFRQAHAEQERELLDRDKQITIISERLTTREEELKSLQKEHREVTEMLERERTRSLESLLDARLMAVEEFARGSSERIEHMVQVLDGLGERAAQQEALTERIMEELRPSRSEPATQKKEPSTEEEEEVEEGKGSQQELAQLARRISSETKPIGGWTKLKASPVVYIVPIALVVVLLVVAAVLLLPASDANEGSSATTQTEAGNTASAESDDAEVEGAEEDAKEEVAAAEADEEDANEEVAAAEESDGAKQEESESAKQEEVAASDASETAVGVREQDATEEQKKARKELRRKFFAALKKRNLAAVAEHGEKLRTEYWLDWEPALRLAEAWRALGKKEEAAAAYGRFIELYPENKNWDEATFRMAHLLKDLERPDEASPLFEKLASKRNSKYRTRAQAALKTLTQ